MALELYRRKQQEIQDNLIENYEPADVIKSDSCGSHDIQLGSFAQITNHSLNVTAKEGETVEISFQSEDGIDLSGWQARNSGDPANAALEIRIMKDGQEAARYTFRHQVIAAGDQFTYIPASSVKYTEKIAVAGTFNYTVEAVRRTGSDGRANYMKMVLKKFNKLI